MCSLPALRHAAPSPGNDVPTVLYTEASVRTFIPLGFHNENITIEVTIDGEGRVIDYSLPNEHRRKILRLHRSIENYLLFTQFTPGTKLRSAREGEGPDLVPEQPHRSEGLSRLEWPDADSVSISWSDRTILERIATAACAFPDHTVIEIGPGKGALTEYLVTTGAARPRD